ncbi:MAG: hypothetical protein U0736_11720 [Gemmataceae bacterium]
MNNLVGGSGVDTYNVSVNHTGNLDGQGGGDVFNLTGGIVTGDLIGDAGDDHFNFDGGSVAGHVTGDAGNDTFDVTAAATVTGGLSGGDGVDTFNIGATLTASINAGVGADIININASGSVSGTVAGGADQDRLSYASYNAAVVVDLAGVGAIDGFNGTANGISGGFTDINEVVGGDPNDTLQGVDANANWDVDGTDLYTSGGNNLEFSDMENSRSARAGRHLHYCRGAPAI